jgi:O-antigen/teichoic acid export membrane protein
LAIGTVASNLLGLLVLIAYNLYGTTEAYGVYSYVMSLLAMLGIASVTGMAGAILVGAAQRKLHILRSGSRLRAKFSLLVGCPILLLTGLVMSFLLPQQKMAGYACLILLPVFPFMFSFTGVYSYLNGLGQFWLVAWAQIIAAFLNLAAVVLSLRFCPDQVLLPPIASLIVKTMFEAGVYVALVRRDRIPILDADTHLLSYGMKITLTGVTGTIESHFDRLVVGFIYGFHNLGMFGGGRVIVLALKQLPSIYYQLYVPKLARKSPAQALASTHRALRWSLLPILCGFAVIFWLLPWFYTTFLGKFGESSTYARWFLLMVLVGVPWYFYYPFFRSQRQARREVTAFWSQTASTAIGLLVLVYFFGLMGVIYAQIVATAILSAISWWQARKSRAIPETKTA